MTRIARVVMPGVPHHIVQRGNRRQRVFFSDNDRRFYLRLLRKHAAEAGIAYWAYCLMENHVHFIAVPQKSDSLARGLGAAHWSYTLHVNIREDWKGYLWQGRFFSCPLDGSYLLAAMRYVECNPVRAGLVPRAEEYPWSSASAHVLKRDDPLIEKCLVQDEIKDWAGFLSIPAPEMEIGVLRQNTRTGRPAGNEDFIERLERSTGRTLRELKRGPKPRLNSSGGFDPDRYGDIG
jgi:putative transposase